MAFARADLALPKERAFNGELLSLAPMSDGLASGIAVKYLQPDSLGSVAHVLGAEDVELSAHL